MTEFLKKKRGLVFQGGGIFGITYVGVIKELERHGLMFDYFVGSSVGSIFALLMACRIEGKYLEDFVLNCNIGQLIDEVNDVEGIYRLYEKFGWHSTDKLRKQLEKVVEAITGQKQLTFKQIQEKYGTYLAMTTYSVSENLPKIYDSKSSPDTNVVDACINSCSVPFFFECNDYIDGGITNNYPIYFMTELIGAEKTLGLQFSQHTGKYEKPTNIYEYTKFILSILFDRALHTHLNDIDLKNTIPITISASFSFLNFELTQEQKQALISDGINAVQSYIVSLK